MIPKIIHYVWLSNEPFPISIQKCIDSWRKVMPDYELMLWDYNRFPRGKSNWVDQAFDYGKYAFAADYIRLYALYNYGGIYLDSDVEILKPFDDLLELPYFIGQENTPLGIEAATLGCEMGWSLIRDMYQRYENREFVNPDGSLNMEPIPAIFRKCIESRYMLHLMNGKSDFIFDDGVVNVFPVDYFSPKTWYNKKLELTSNTYSIHHFAASWKTQDSVSQNAGLLKRIKRKSVKELRHFLYKRQERYIFTNVHQLAEAFYEYYRVPECSPFVEGSMSVEDIVKLSQCLICKENLTLNFIKSAESKYQVDDFYPIARLGDSDLEIKFVDESVPVRNVITKHWNERLDSVDFDKICFVIVVENRKECISHSDNLFKTLYITPEDFNLENELVVPGLKECGSNKFDWSDRRLTARLVRAIQSL